MIGNKKIHIAAMMAAIAIGFMCMPGGAAEVRLFNKTTPPAGAELKTQLAQVNDVFKDDIAAAKIPEMKLALGQKLFAAAKSDKDPNAKYALLVRAGDFAAEGGDIDLAMAIAAVTEKEYEISGAKLKLDAATAVSSFARTPDQQAKFLIMCASEIAAAMNADDFTAARQYSALEVGVAKLTTSTQIFKDALERLEKIKEVEAAGTEAKNAAAILATKPDDAESNLKIGRYLCLYKRDWNKGIPALAKSNDPLLRAAAVLEAANPKSIDDKNKTADAWWDAAVPLKGAIRTSAQARAVSYYKQTLDGTPAGLSKARVEKRIAEYEQSIGGAAAPVVVVRGGGGTTAPILNVREKDCIGVWVVGKGPRSITINADHTASQSSNKSVTGTWELVNGEIQVLYSHGWRNHIVPKDGKFVMNAYAPKKEITDTPYETRDISKSTATTIPK